MIKECSNCIYYEPKCKSITFRITNGICEYKKLPAEQCDTCGHWGTDCTRFKPKKIKE
ncbi:MAG TPA: hypothetical protein VMX17_15685 [Candidatus Glassbacteria bacterium]|nr:hypothetical protein [Candidatus Glassbacteria bacterium]